MYGILNLIRKLYGRPAMRRVLEIIKKHPEARPVKNLKSDMFTDESRLATAEGLAEGSSRWLDPHPGTFMNYVRHKVPNREMFKDTANYYRLNPDKRKIMDEWYQETGAKGWWSQGFMDNMIKDAIRAMAGKNLKTRGPTDHEKYLLALLRQKRKKSQEGAKILQFPKRD
jgi:hypothetical protein